MATIIKKIRLINFKRFKDYVIEPNKRINVFIGDNEAGKSSILEAIALVSNGNVGRVESIGLDRLFNNVTMIISSARLRKNLMKGGRKM